MNQQKIKPAIRPLAFSLLIGFVILLILLYFYYKLVSCKYSDLPSRGQFGDMFGAANSLLSGLGFSALVYSLYMQRLEMSAQSSAATEEKRNLEAHLQQVELQNKLFQLNHFESIFMGLISLLKDEAIRYHLDCGDESKFTYRIGYALDKAKINPSTSSIEEMIPVLQQFTNEPITQLYTLAVNYISKCPASEAKANYFKLVIACLVGNSYSICSLYSMLLPKEIEPKDLLTHHQFRIIRGSAVYIKANQRYLLEMSKMQKAD